VGVNEPVWDHKPQIEGRSLLLLAGSSRLDFLQDQEVFDVPRDRAKRWASAKKQWPRKCREIETHVL
jgi:hypothetical protein